MKNYKILVLLSFLLATSNLCAGQESNRWSLRIGGIGTGTSDEGIWRYVVDGDAASFQFKFGNSWGIAVDLDYYMMSSFTIGLHSGFSSTRFEVELGSEASSTSFNPLLVEMKYEFFSKNTVSPIIGASTGWLFTDTATIPSSIGEEFIFSFDNPFIYGFLVGLDVDLDNDFYLHTLIRALSFEYSLSGSEGMIQQTLLDQVYWMNYNHIQIGIGKKF